MSRWSSRGFTAYWAPLAVVLAAAACSGSGGSPSSSGSCLTSADCGAGEACVNKTCEPRSGPGLPDASADTTPAPTPTTTPTSTGPSCTCNGVCCAADETCQAGVCMKPCVPAGSSCTSTGECCQSGTGMTAGAVCISNDNLCHAKCSANSDCQSGCCAQVQGESYGGCAASSVCQPTGVGVGGACTSNASCSSGACNGLWCTESCSPANSACAGGYAANGLYNEYGQFNWCLRDSAGSDVCFPGCSTNGDCAPFAGTSCKTFVDVTGYTTSVCSR